MNNAIRYMYVRDHNHAPCGCLAIKVRRSLNRVEYGISMCNPLDMIDDGGRAKRFDRVQAQYLAEARLFGELNVAYVDSESTQHEISAAVMRDIIANGVAPTRAIKFAKRWLESFQFNNLAHSLIKG